MLKYVKGMYKGQAAHIVIDSEEVKYFSVDTGLLIGIGCYAALPNKYLFQAVECMIFSLLVETKTGVGQFAGFNGDGKFMAIPNITQVELDKTIARLRKRGIVCRLQVKLIDGVIEYLYIVRGGSVV